MTAKKLLFILVAALISIPQIYSQGTGFNSVYSKDGIGVIAVGNNGNVFRSYDGGLTYGSYPVGVVNLNSIVTFGSTIIIAGNSGLVFYSTNDGATWNNLVLGSQNFNCVSFADANNGWLVGDNGTIYKSVNGGLNWTSQTSGTSNNLHSVKAMSSTVATCCGDNGTCIYTTNGASWIPYSVPTTKNLLSIGINGGTTICTGADGFIVKYVSGTWTTIDYQIQSKSEVRSIAMINSTAFFTCGGGGFINFSNDAGSTFQYIKNPMIGKLSSIFFYNTNNGWACASTNNAIIRTTDGGVTWNFPTGVSVTENWVLKQSTSGNIGNGFCLHPQTNKNEIFICAGNHVYRSMDIGETWTQIATVSAGSQCHSFYVSALDTNTMLASMDSGGGRVLKSTNYGSTWTTTWGPGTLTSYGMPLENDRNNPNICFLSPDNALTLRSTDFGSTWNTWGTKVFRSPCDIDEMYGNSNIMWIADGVTGSGQGDFWKSTNNGVDWNYVQTTSGSEIPMIATTQLRPGLVYHTTWSSGGFWKSTDQGSTFIMTSGAGGNLWGADIAKDDPNSVVYGTYGNTGYLSTDDGNTFVTQSLVGSPGAGTLYYDKANAFMQQGSGVYKMNLNYTVPVVTGTHQISSQAPERFALAQNFPNPFNPSTRVNFDVSRTSSVSIKVYDILGNEVRTIVNGNMSAGRYTISFDASQLASGVYFYSLFSDGIKMDSKKMLLVK